MTLTFCKDFERRTVRDTKTYFNLKCQTTHRNYKEYDSFNIFISLCVVLLTRHTLQKTQNKLLSNLTLPL